jgi:hypothetical protein
VLEDWRVRLISAELRKVILVASQFFDFFTAWVLRVGSLRGSNTFGLKANPTTNGQVSISRFCYH